MLSAKTKKPVIFEDFRNGRYMENSVSTIFDSDNKISRFAIYSRDITERKLSELKMQKKKQINIQ